MKGMIKVLVILYSFFILSFSYGRISPPYIITNSTNYDVEIYMLWNKLHSTNASSFYLKQVIPALTCLTIDKMYFDYDQKSCADHAGIWSCMDWLYLNRPLSLLGQNLAMFINDEEENAYEVLLYGGDLANYEVIGEKSNILGFFDSFDVITDFQNSNSVKSCKKFHPEDAFLVGKME